MSKGSEQPEDLLSALDLGPAWARGDEPKKNYENHKGDRGEDRRGRGRGRQGGGGRGRGRRDDAQGERSGGGNFRGGRGGQRQGGRGRGRENQGNYPTPAEGVKVSLIPNIESVHLIVKEINHRARVYSLFDLAQLFLGSRERYCLQIDVDEKRPKLYRGKSDTSLFLTKEEAAAHFFQSESFSKFYETEEVETDPPKGNFQVVAKCGISGEWLGPPNFHSYQANLRRLHRERFGSMPFERYASRVRTERGEDAVNEWMDSMKKRTRWRPVGGDDDSWTFERQQIERDFMTRGFADAFEEVRKTELPGDVEANQLSEGVLAAIRIASGHARRHPAMIIPTICRMLESDHLSIFKKQGKLFCGPARPHPLVNFDELSERPAAIVRWLDANPDANLEGLWKALLPAGVEEPPKEWLVDLFWLLSQGHVLLFSDSKMVLPKKRQSDGQDTKRPSKAGKETQPSGAKPKGKTKRKRRRRSKGRKARVLPHAATVRRITRMNHGSLKRLRGESRLWFRRLAKRDRINVLREE